MTEVILLDDSDSDTGPPPPRRPQPSRQVPARPAQTGGSFCDTLRSLIASRATPDPTPRPELMRNRIPHPNSENEAPVCFSPPPRRGRGRGRGRPRGRARASTRAPARDGNPAPSPAPLPNLYDFDVPSPLQLDDHFDAPFPLPLDDSNGFPDYNPPALSLHQPSSSMNFAPQTHPRSPAAERAAYAGQMRAAAARKERTEVEAEAPAPTTTSRPSSAPMPTTATRPASGGSRVQRDDVEILISRELAARPDGLALLGKLVSCEGTSATVSSLAQGNMLEWRRRGADVEDGVDEVAFYFGADQFVELMTSGSMHGLARQLRERHPSVPIFFLLDGVQAFCRKAARRRVRAKAGTDAPSVVSEAAVEDCCTFLYFEFEIRSRLFTGPADAAQFCMCIADAVAKKPYMEELSFVNLRAAYVRGKTGNAAAALCIEGSGDVRAERRKDLGAAYQAFLGLVPGVSVSRAKAIRRVYPTLALLLEAYKRCSSDAERDAMLADVCEKGRRLGPALSKTIANVLTSTNPAIEVSQNSA